MAVRPWRESAVFFSAVLGRLRVIRFQRDPRPRPPRRRRSVAAVRARARAAALASLRSLAVLSWALRWGSCRRLVT